MQFTANGMSGKTAYARKNAEEASEHNSELRISQKHMVGRVKEKVYCENLVTSTSVQVSHPLLILLYILLISICSGSALHINDISLILIVNGRWGVFGDWEECPVTCGGGTRNRFRECNNPAPQHGGDTCTVDGSTYFETETCNHHACPPG